MSDGMDVHTNLRVMWLLNHSSARRFELAMLKQLGVREIFLPKSYPLDPAFRSASVDYAEDAHLSIPPADLAVLNAANWYADPGKAVWEVANRHFDVLFFILHDYSLLKGIARHFRGVALLRAYGMPREHSYSHVLHAISRLEAESLVHQLGRRIFFAQAYPHLHQCELDFLSQRRLYLPLGLDDARMIDRWSGNDKRVFFVCPDIGYNDYYRKIYQQFTEDFKGLPYAVGGAQPVAVRDRRVLGYLPREDHERNMREMRTMFYHGTEPNHVHYHPFEAVRAGMPLLFMGGGMLDRLGGDSLPGRCRSTREARAKMSAVLDGERSLVDAIRASQPVLLDAMRPERLVDDWRTGFARVHEALAYARQVHRPRANKRLRVAVIVPVGYRGGSLRAAKLVARAIDLGARQAGKPVDVVFGYLDYAEGYQDEEFSDLPPTITRRPYKWKTLEREAAVRSLRYARCARPLPADYYQVPEDGIQQFTDCDLWLIVSDRLDLPLLPLRPYALIVYDYLQRYLSTKLPDNWKCLHAAHGAERVLVTTDFTYGDALQFAGLDKEKIVRVPMLAPEFPSDKNTKRVTRADYFIWTTNLAAHKNHQNAGKALQIYYENLDGQLNCRVTGVGTERLLTEGFPHLQHLRGMLTKNPRLKNRMRFLGELPDASYRARLAGASFLWHPGSIDNGTFSVIEAAYLRVPALSSIYPAMQEIDRQYTLGLTWMDAHDPDDMANQLKFMEANAGACRARLPSREHLMGQRLENLAQHYWKAVEDCL
jgi:glycosyltransferase involved in cell wall biosynthesis